MYCFGNVLYDVNSVGGIFPRCLLILVIRSEVLLLHEVRLGEVFWRWMYQNILFVKIFRLYQKTRVNYNTFGVKSPNQLYFSKFVDKRSVIIFRGYVRDTMLEKTFIPKKRTFFFFFFVCFKQLWPFFPS